MGPTTKSEFLPLTRVPSTADPRASGEALELGYISGIFGVRGEVRLFLHHAGSDLLAAKARDVVLRLKDGTCFAARVRSRRGAGKRVLGVVQGFSRREHAEAVQDATLWIARNRLPQLTDADDFYVWQVEGADVLVHPSDEAASSAPAGVVATVTTVHSTEGGDVFEVVLPGQGEPVFLPAVKAMVHRIDGKAGQLWLTQTGWDVLAAELDDDAAETGP